MSEGKRVKKLRELLDARGIQWYVSGKKLTHPLTQWDVDGLNYSAAALWPRNDETQTKMIVHVSGLTPEQAVSLSPERTCRAILKEPRWAACECSVCGGALESFNKFCPNCGAKVVAVDERTCKVVRYDAGGGAIWLTCSECGNIMPEHDNYCSSCGARVVKE